MNQERKKRAPRTPLSPEEVEDLIYFKKIREHKKLLKFKKSPVYRVFNVLNILCFFIYLELICCFAGPASYRWHYSSLVRIQYGEVRGPSQQRSVVAVTMRCVENRDFRFSVSGEMEIPQPFQAFSVGSDFILRKELKGSVVRNGQIYKLERASPIIFLSVFVGLFNLILFVFDLNQNPYSLTSLSSVNLLTVFAFILI
jgi:hypothetical protein